MAPKAAKKAAAAAPVVKGKVDKAAVLKKPAAASAKTEKQVEQTKKHMEKAMKKAKEPVEKVEEDVVEATPLKKAPEVPRTVTPVKEASKAPPTSDGSLPAWAVRRLPKPPAEPKRIVGGAYGMFMEEKRASIVASLPEGADKIGGVAKRASELYKALSQEERKVYEDKFEKRRDAYNVARADWLKAMHDGGFAIPTGKPADKAPAKRKIFMNHKEKVDVSFDADALREASGLGFEEVFRSLASNAVIASRKIPHDKLVRALRASGGKERKAYMAVMA